MTRTRDLYVLECFSILVLYLYPDQSGRVAPGRHAVKPQVCRSGQSTSTELLGRPQ